MVETRDLLVEIGTEELPPKALEKLSSAFLTALCDGFTQQRLSYQSAIPYATPRRLAVLVKDLVTVQEDFAVERRGPALNRAYDADGRPTPAALGFARACEVDVTALEISKTDKGDWLVYRKQQPGQPTAQLIQGLVESALAAIPIPKRMRWSDLPFEFVRPVHWVVLLFGQELITATILGIASGRETRGHRFHHPEPIILTEANEYADILQKKGYVLPLFSARRAHIRRLIEQAAEEVQGQAVISEDLLNEVTSLVEWPIAVVGAFDSQFLDIPAEALIATMQGHQKWFPLKDAQGKLLPYFIGMSNIESLQPDTVRAGYERVIRPRLSDAAFFWTQDRTQTLESRLKTLERVIFQDKLGSLCDKAKRVAKLAGFIADTLNGDEKQGIRAGHLSKCDLVTDMVSEFPELQGIMGEYYALHDGETHHVTTALREQYLPRFSGDVLPKTTIGQALAIADRIDTLVGIFGIDQAPTGDKDPFGLRRAALGILRIMIEGALPLDLEQLLSKAQSAYPNEVLLPQTSQVVLTFVLERLRSYYQDRGIRYDTVDAVLAAQPTSPLDIDSRIQGVETFRTQADALSLATANKRIHNILKKAEGNFPAQPNPTYFTDAVERRLYDAMETVNEQITPLLVQGNYQMALQILATLRQPVDDFFDKVMVMDENSQIRTNRLAFLQAIRQVFLRVADISQLQI